MASGLIDPKGFDLDQDFEPRQSGDPQPANTDVMHGTGVDCSAVYAPLSVGSGLGYNTDIESSAAVDLSAIFAKKGSRTGASISASIPASATFYTATSGGSPSGQLTVNVAGGTPPYTYSWVWMSGSPTITNANSQTCTVSEATTGTVQSVIQCNVTDSKSVSIASNDCTVSFVYVPALEASIPGSATFSTSTSGGTASGSLSCTASGGSGTGYTYQWNLVSGTAAIANATSQTCTVSEATTGTVASVFSCTVHDSTGAVVTSSQCTVSFAFVPPVAASVPSTVTYTSATSGGTASGSLSCTASGGSGTGYTYQWNLVSGLAAITNATSQTCTVSEAFPTTGSVTSVFSCTVHDSTGAVVTSNQCTATFMYSAGGGGGCLMLDAWLMAGLKVRDALRGMMLDGRLNEVRQPLAIVNDPRIVTEECFRLITEGGAAIPCTGTTPFDTVDGRSVLAPDMMGEMILCHHDDIGERWEPVVRIEPLGIQEAMRISLGGASYLGGEDPAHRGFSHNSSKV